MLFAAYSSDSFSNRTPPFSLRFVPCFSRKNPSFSFPPLYLLRCHFDCEITLPPTHISSSQASLQDQFFSPSSTSQNPRPPPPHHRLVLLVNFFPRISILGYILILAIKVSTQSIYVSPFFSCPRWCFQAKVDVILKKSPESPPPTQCSQFTETHLEVNCNLSSHFARLPVGR